MSEKEQAQKVLANLGPLLPDLESVYKDIHSHPELSMQEKRTAVLPRTGSARPVTR
jgi:metal-dependent amidase/aminoacylase/carboxypeptidase family protein